MSYCTGCGRPTERGEHAVCRRRQQASDPPRFCPRCSRKLVVQVLPTSWRAQCVKCGSLDELAPARTPAPHAR